MKKQSYILGLVKLSQYIQNFLSKNEENYDENDEKFYAILRKSEIENPWFSIESQKLALAAWADLFTEEPLSQWLRDYPFAEKAKKVGLILAGNIPLVGLHDVICTLMSGHTPMIKLSSKDQRLLPYLLELWNGFSEEPLPYQLVEKLTEYDAVIATGSNNTARYLDYYFKDSPRLIRKNRTSVAVLSGAETDADLQALARDIFQYFGLGCRNVTRLFLPKDFGLERLFENFMNYQHIINHYKYANNYDYNRAVFLLNQEPFWDNNFVLIKEDEALFSPLGVLHFSRYETLDAVQAFLSQHEQDIQCVVASQQLLKEAVPFGQAQCPTLDTYADNVDTMQFLAGI